MPTIVRDQATIRYEEKGSGPPLLTIAPGGMRSMIDMWANAAIDPWASFGSEFRMVAMDQRNSGRSTGPLDSVDPWGMYAADQLAVMDQLGIDRFLVMGCCIGGSFILKLIQLAPERVAAAVLEQPIGVQDSNRALFAQLQQSWAEELTAGNPDVDGEAIEGFLAAMWNDDFVVSVGRDFISTVTTPMLVLPGIDDYHPTEAGREVAALAPAARALEPWKDTPAHVAATTDQVRRFLLDQAGRSGL